MESEFIYGQMEGCTLGSSSKASSMAKEYSSVKMESRNMESGKMEIEIDGLYSLVIQSSAE